MPTFIRSTPRTTRLAALSVLAAAAISPSALGAQVLTSWLNPTSGFWSSAANWSASAPNNGSPAGTTYDVVIDALGGPYTVTLNTAVTVDRLRVDSDDATLYVHALGSLSILTDSSVDRGTLEVNGALTGPGALTVNSSMLWNEGPITGPGALNIGASGSLSLSPSGSVRTLARSLNNAGTISGTGTITLGATGSPAVVNNLQSGVMNSSGAMSWNSVVAGSAFNNAGTVNVLNGTLFLAAPGQNTGRFNVAQDATLYLGASYTHAASGIIDGPGDVQFNGGTHTFGPGQFLASGGVQATATSLTFNDAVALSSLSLFSSGTTRFNNALTLESLMINGNTRAIFNAPVIGLKSVTVAGTSVPTILPVSQLERLTVPSGQINLAGDLTITNALNFGGTLVNQENPGKLILAPTCLTRISGSSIGAETYRDVINHGALSWHGDGGVLQSQWSLGTTTLHNASLGVITTSGYTHLFGGTFINDGTLIHLGSSTLGTAFNNNGSMHIEGNIVQMYGGTSAGAFHIAQGSRLELGSAHVFAPGARILGEGELRFAGGTNTIDPTTIFQASHVSVSGTATSTINAALTLQRISMFGGSLTLNDTLSASELTSKGGTLIVNGHASLGSMLLTGGILRFNAGLALPSPNLTVNGGYLNVNNVNAEMASVSLQAGGIGGSADLIVNDSLYWSSGTMYDVGRTIVSPSGTLMIGPSGAQGLRRTLENHGAATWIGSRLYFNTDVNNSSGVFINRPGATLDVSGAASIQVDSSWPFTHDFTNEGIMNNASTAAIVTGSRLRFNNHGTINLLAGSLSLDGGGAFNGLYHVAKGVSFSIRSSLTSGPGAAIAGDGAVSMTTGALTFGAGRFSFTGDLDVSAGALTVTDSASLRSLAPVSGSVAFLNGLSLVSGAQLSLTGSGSLTINNYAPTFDSATISTSSGLHGSAALQFNQSLNWINGAMTGAGITTIAPAATLDMTQFGVRELSRRLDLAGALNWSNGTFALSFGGLAGVLNILPSGVMNFAGVRTIAGVTGSAFNNAGIVNVNSGALTIASGGAHAGSFNVASGASLELSGLHSFTNAAPFQGPGTLILKTTFTPIAAFNHAGSVTFSGGADAAFNHGASFNEVRFEASTVRFNTSPITAATARLQGGVVTFDAPAIFDAVIFTAGTIGGSGDVTIAGPTTTWLAGAMAGPGKTIYGPNTLLTCASGVRTLARTLDFHGSAAWTAGAFTFGDASGAGIWNNHAGAIFSAGIPGTISAVGADNAFNNFGTFRRSGSGTTTFSSGVAFNNHAVVNALGGVLQLFGGGSHTGAFNLAPTSTLRLNGAHTFAASSSIDAAQATVEISGGATSLLTALTAAQLNINAGTLSGSGTINAAVVNNGTLAPGAPHGGLLINGAYTQSSTGNLSIEIFSPSNADRVTITGPASLAGSLAISLDTNLVTPQWGQSWTIASYASRTGDFATFTATSVNALDLRWWRNAGATDYILGLRHVADTNRDGVVDFLDLNNVLGTFGQSAPGSFGQLGLVGDANEDGNVDLLDLNLILSFFGQRAPASPVPATPTATLLSLAATTLGSRRRRSA